MKGISIPNFPVAIKRFNFVFAACFCVLLAIGGAVFGWLKLGKFRDANYPYEVGYDFIAEKEASLLGGNAFVTQGHTVNQLAYSPDGVLLASVASTSAGNVRPGVQIWNAESGEDIGLTALRKRDIESLAWSPRRNIFVCSDREGAVEIWDADACQHLRTLFVDGNRVNCVAWSPDGKWIAAAQKNGTTYLWNTSNWRKRDLQVASHCIRFLPNSHSLVIGQDSLLTIIPVEERSPSRTIPLKDKAKAIHDLAISADSKYVVVCTFERIKSIELATGKQICSVTGESMYRMAISLDGSKLAVSSIVDEGRLFDFEDDGQLYRKYEFVQRGWATAFSPDGKKIALATRRISFLDAESGKALSNEKSHCAVIHQAYFVDEGETLITFDAYNQVAEWNIRNRRLTSLEKGSDENKRMLIDSTKGFRLVPTDEPNQIVFRNRDDPSLRKVFNDRGRPVISSAISSTEKYVGVLTVDGTLMITNTMTDEKISFLYKPFEHDLVGHVAFSPDEKLIAALYPNHEAIRVYDIAERKLLCEIAGGSIIQSTFAISPDSKRIAYSKNKKIIIADLRSGESQVIMQDKLEMVSNAAYSPNGKMVAASGRIPDTLQDVVRIWSAETGEVLLELRGHVGFISEVEFAPSGDSLISASNDSTILLWDIRRAILKL